MSDLGDLKEKIIHKYLRIPYSLNVVELKSPQKPKSTIVLIHGIGNSVEYWRELVTLLPDNVRVIAVDLLGFGESPKPSWVKYEARDQVKSLAVTLIKMKVGHKMVVVGHSLGALVSVALAKKFPFIVDNLILCSPPIYKIEDKKLLSHDKVLRDMYKIAINNPEALIKLSSFALKAGIVNKTFNVNDDNVKSYISALGSSVVNQSTYDDLLNIGVPVKILYGTLDPVVIGDNIQSLVKSAASRATRAKKRSSIAAIRIVSGHEVVGGYTRRLAKEIRKSLGLS